MNTDRSALYDLSFILGSSEITVKENRCTISLVTGAAGSITFEEGTADGEIGIVNGAISVTDSGNNSILTGS